MSNVLFLNIPAHGHVNPTIGIVDALIKQGDTVTYFCSEEFREQIEKTNAQFREYGNKLDIFNNEHQTSGDLDIMKFLYDLNGILEATEETIEYILRQIDGISFDYIVYGAMFPYGNIISQILRIPAIVSHAVFATPQEMMATGPAPGSAPFPTSGSAPFPTPGSAPFPTPGSAPFPAPGSAPFPTPGSAPFPTPGSAPFPTPGSAPFPTPGSAPASGAPGLPPEFPLMKKYIEVSTSLKIKYGVKMPELLELFFNKGDLNIVYSSKYFVGNSDYYDDSFRFIGPPVYDKKETVEFPFDEIKDKKVVYISLGTVFNNTNDKLYKIFFDTFANYDATIVMTAFNMDTTKLEIPKNFIVKNYVPQVELLKYTNVAIIHAGMNTANDLLYSNVPFVCIPIGADQPLIASKAAKLGATISLDKDTITKEILMDAVEKVQNDPSFLENIKKISTSFIEAGGYNKVIEEIDKFKKERDIQ